MLTKTSETAIQTLVYLALSEEKTPITPAHIAEILGASQTYLAKICTLLVKAGILRAQRGVKGGVVLGKSVQEITLLDIVEACQGRILGDYCQEHDKPEQVCGFHHAMYELHRNIVATLGCWTLADIAARPLPIPELRPFVRCRMGRVCSGQPNARS
ncbi:MAG TPA: Rrf2 family transcriptional regulator [Candidatus Hydrogenedentes bacterium]|nr:Rrf2 family transcriptional regulator [Candidatus Hydrogenedentota bacterium]HOS03441.1 Rrf2 family transcriptional regulator [Candidatus Hydrogenedentota bacterium]